MLAFFVIVLALPVVSPESRAMALCPPLYSAATANVDWETDGHIQETLRREFTSCTVLVIAHRTETGADSDRILEMSRGQIASLDAPLVRLPS